MACADAKDATSAIWVNEGEQCRVSNAVDKVDDGAMVGDESGA